MGGYKNQKLGLGILNLIVLEEPPQDRQLVDAGHLIGRLGLFINDNPADDHGFPIPDHKLGRGFTGIDRRIPGGQRVIRGILGHHDLHGDDFPVYIGFMSRAIKGSLLYFKATKLAIGYADTQPIRSFTHGNLGYVSISGNFPGDRTG